MKKPDLHTVAVVGTGVIGRSWIAVFARAGRRVRVFDANPAQAEAALAWFRADLKRQRRDGRLKKKAAAAQWDLVEAVDTLAGAVAGAGYVQESGPERLDLKQALYRDLDQAAHPATILGSSTSALDMTDIARGLAGAGRCIVVHPVNPPHVVPATEILGGAETSPAVVKRTIRFLKELGQVPVLMNRYVPGFVINRMQAALIREAVDLVRSGVCDVRAVDDSIRAGLGLRWALMGPFGVANTNADGGVRDYFTRFGSSYHGLWDDLKTDLRFDPELIERIGQQTDRLLPESLDAQRAWRDRLVLELRALKAATPLESGRGKRKRKRKR